MINEFLGVQNYVHRSTGCIVSTALA